MSVGVTFGAVDVKMLHVTVSVSVAWEYGGYQDVTHNGVRRCHMGVQ